MKKNNIFRISVLPLILLTVLAFSSFQPGKNNHQDKGNKSKGNNKEHQDKEEKGKSSKSNDHKMTENDHSKNKDHGNKGQDNYKMKNHSYKHKGDHRMLNGKRDMKIDWNMNNFADRKHPKDQKKVEICHHPNGNGSDAVTIRVSENALQAHLNHGDVMGNCNINYSDRWSPRYVSSRENVYNTYETSLENLSFSEALLQVALQKLVGYKTSLSTNRTTFTASEFQRRENLIMDLQNNVNSLQSQVDYSRQNLDSGVNIIIKL